MDNNNLTEMIKRATKNIHEKESISYRYLLSYMYNTTGEQTDGYKETGNGRIILNLDSEINSDEDIIKVENIIKQRGEITCLENVYLNAFSLICKEIKL